jgi:hypothetical protein
MSSPLNHDDNGAAEATLPRHDVNTESCWRWRCRGNIGCSVMSMSSHADVVPIVAT